MTTARSKRGSALILSLWALLLLSAAVFAWLKLIDQDLTVATEANAGLEARAFAHSGVAIALHTGVTQVSPLLEKQFEPDRGFKTQIKGEAGRMNINWLLQSMITAPAAPESTVKIDFLKRYLERRGLSFQEREALVDCLLDWIDPDNLRRLNGAEDEPGYRPPNRGSFVSVEEMTRVKGAKPLVSQPKWKEDFTIFTAGPIDLQFASADVLRALPLVGDPGVERFLQVRRGPDKVDGTKDDHIFATTEEALSYLGLAGAAAQQVGSLVAQPGDAMVHIVSVGQSGKVYRQVEVVARKVGTQPRIFWWKE